MDIKQCMMVDIDKIVSKRIRLLWNCENIPIPTEQLYSIVDSKYDKKVKNQGLSNNIYLISRLLNTLIKLVVLYWFTRFLLGNKIFIVVGLGYKFLQVILLIEFDSIIFLWQDLCWGFIASWITDQHQNRSNCVQRMT